MSTSQGEYLGTSYRLFCFITFIVSSFPSSKYDPYFAVDMCGVMALATKYDFSDLRLRIVRHFQQEWPTSAHTWEAWVKQSDAQLILNNKSRYDHPHDVVNLHWPEPASAIHFARAFDIPSVLPAAFYRLSLIQTEIDWDRYDQLDFPYDDRLVARWSLLNAEDLMTVMQLKFRCARLMERMPVSLSKMTCDCGDEGCTGSLQKLWAMISESHTASESDPLQAFSMRWRDDHTAYYGVCHSMYTQYRQQAEIIMEGIWKDLQIIVTVSLQQLRAGHQFYLNNPYSV